MRKYALILALVLTALFLSPELSAQSRRPRRGGQTYGMRIEKQVNAPDSATLARRDSIRRADSLHRADSARMLGKSSLTAPAFTTARDSILEVFSNGQRKIYYYGDVTVKYDNMELTAEYMEYDMNTGTVFAHGIYDSLAEEWVGRPVMTQDGKTYEMEEVHYNFDSGKARIKNMKTTEDEGIIHGQNIKMMKDRSINMTKGKYTVCDADHPHYYLKMSAAKIITDPSQKTVFGPANVVIEDVNIPFLGLPFGFVPERPKRATGILMPTFGEEESRGFYLKDAGMYFVFGDYLDLSITGDYFTLGSWAVDINSRYKVNYKFNGNLSLNYSNDQVGEKGTPEYFQTRNFGVKWSHSQDSKAHPGMNFSASVNFQSPQNNHYNSHSIDEALQSQISSSISWSRNWNGKFNLSINGTHSQNMRDSSYTFTLPNISFSMSTIYPFKRKNRVGKERFYEKFSIGYNTSFQNKINFKSSEFDVNELLGKFQTSMTHNFSIGLPSFQLFKYISVAPGVSYGMNWHFRKNDYQYNPETDQVEQIEGRQFNTFGITQRYSFNISASTRLYGMFNFGKHSKVQTIRHVVSPSLSFSLSPDLNTYANGYRTLHYTDASGMERDYRYNIYRAAGVSVPSGERSATASISIGNNLEAKVRDYADTTGKGNRKVKLIDQFNINTGYNFLADSLNMSVVSMTMSTTLFDKVSLSGSASFNPYAIGPNGTTVNRFAISEGQGLLRFNSASLSASYSLTGKGKINGNDGSKDAKGGGSATSTNAYRRIYYHPVTGEFIPDGWLYYTNPNAPWSLNLSGVLSMNRRYYKDLESGIYVGKNDITATLSATGNIQLTPKMSINLSTGFDFVAMKMTTTQLSATYDLHCFNISVSWVPTGQWKSYSFRIAANAAALSDLLRFRKSDSYWDNR